MPEFSRLLKNTEFAALPIVREIRATAEECGGLARRFRLEGVERLTARLEVSAWHRNGVRVVGALDARLTQRCVVSLEVMPQRVSRRFVSFFTAPGMSPPPPESLPPSVLEDGVEVEAEDPEEMGEKGVDLGELAAQQLSLALDPYPQLPDARLPESAAASQAAMDAAASLGANPLAASLAALVADARREG